MISYRFYSINWKLDSEANVNVVLGSLAISPVMNGNSIGGVIFESKQGRYAVLSKTVIDATGYTGTQETFER